MIWAATPVGRGVRAAAVAVFAVALAIAAHHAACGDFPSIPVTIGGAGLATRVCWGATSRRMSVRRLSGLVVFVQTGLHLAFTFTGPTGLAATGVDHAGHASPVGMHSVVDAGDAVLAAGTPGVDLLPGGPVMLVAHLFAAFILAAWLAVGERLLWRAARGVATAARRVARSLLRRRAELTCPSRAELSPSVEVACRAPRLTLLCHLLVRRGPPSAVLAA